jgi:hypothetical protein
MLTEKQYQNLIKFIDDKFDKDSAGKYILIKTDAVYGNNDTFTMQRQLLHLHLQHLGK